MPELVTNTSAKKPKLATTASAKTPPANDNEYETPYRRPKGTKRSDRSNSSKPAPPPKKPKTAPVAASQTTPPLWQHTPEDSSSEDDLPMMTSHKRRKSTHVTPPVAVAASTTTTRRASSPTTLARRVASREASRPVQSGDITDLHQEQLQCYSRALDAADEDATPPDAPAASPAIDPNKLTEAQLLRLLDRRRSLESAASSHPLQDPNDSSNIICSGCGLSIDKDFVDMHTCNKRGASVAAPKPTKTPEDWDSGDEIELAIRNLEEEEVKTDEGVKYAESTVYSAGHKQRRDKQVQEVFDTIVENKATLGSLADLVPDSTGVYVPRAFVVLGGVPTKKKAKLASKILFLYAKRQRNTRAKPGECPYLQPNAQSTYMRTVMSAMKEEHEWEFSLEKDFNFQGGLSARMNKMFNDRKKEWPGVYGTGSKVQIPKNAESSGEVDLLQFDEDNLHEHQQKLLIICGCFLGLRGRNEHAYLETNNIIEGFFPADHEFGGQPFIGIDGFTDKTHKITMTNPIVRKTKGVMRLPVDVDDLSSPGGCIKRYMNKISPGQTRVYCYEAAVAEKRRFAAANHPNAAMSPNKPIGVNPLGKMITAAAKKVGLDVTGQGLRRLFVTTLVNAPGVNPNESLASARHSSVAAQRPYMVRNRTSEAAKFDALGLSSGKGGNKGAGKGDGKGGEE